MNSFKNMVPRTINYLPNYETVNDSKFKYEIYKIAKQIAIMRFLKIEKNRYCYTKPSLINFNTLILSL